jgi:uncharacterized membrane protein YphA (DoxX/SURF4 family)
VALFGFVLVDMLLTNFVDLGRLPTTVMRPTGFMQVFPWRFYEVLVTPGGMLTLKVLVVVSFAAAAVGYSTSVSTKAAALLFLFFQGLVRSFSHFNHDEMPMVYMLIVLAFTPCGDTLSVDSWLRPMRRRVGDVVYGFPILLLRSLLAWSYFSSGLIKLRVAGLGYFNPDNLPALAITHSLDNLHDTQYRFAFWLPNARGATTLLVILVVLWELTFPLAIFSKIARRIILPFGIVFHLSTIFFMNVSFPYHLAAYAVFVDWPRVFNRIAQSKPGLRVAGAKRAVTSSSQ